jgi:hypothetical protein
MGLSVITQRTLCTLAAIDPRLLILLSVTEPNVPVCTRWDQPFKTHHLLSILQRTDIQINSRTSVLGTGTDQSLAIRLRAGGTEIWLPIYGS